ncbi:SNARE associated Golgi protein [Alkaliphilus metalliredigens QYMF]|uniref:TVP38/TMEM64 family membrane protein n=1 Tax=Alkaliphilus metalliredigens (strain QYMF) TaxID=293826 RepID=A6TT88_ALKMQ|nr:VTT domain-containing protein [Alkaliphilus metalliredigens]ABR49406.1 SNARE associated Golgi protein [Alkaliphilus metalliredigens QYMF]
MGLTYLLIAFIQPILLFTPEMVTITGGSLALGPFKGFIIGYLGILSGIITMYFMGRYAQQIIVKRVGKEELFDKYTRLVEKNGEVIIGLLFILPVLPDNIICAGAGASKVSFKRFVFIAAVAKLITTFVYAYSMELVNILPITELQLFVGQLVIVITVVLINHLVKRRKLKVASKLLIKST